jgi:hypothetical protein
MTDQHAAATPDALVDANVFDIVGPIRINFSSSSISGVPLMSYKDSEFDLNFEDDEITRIETSLGELVTVTLENAVDALIRTFTLVVPTIRVADEEKVVFHTFGVETTDCSGAFRPPPGPTGVLQINRFHQLTGSAQRVES